MPGLPQGVVKSGLVELWGISGVYAGTPLLRDGGITLRLMGGLKGFGVFGRVFGPWTTGLYLCISRPYGRVGFLKVSQSSQKSIKKGRTKERRGHGSP